MYEAFLEPTFAHDTDRLEEIAEMDAEVDALHGRIVEYLAQISSGELSRKETDALIRLMQAANQIEHMGDLIETNLVRLGQKLAAGRQVSVSPMTGDIIRDYHRKIGDALRQSTEAFSRERHEARTSGAENEAGDGGSSPGTRCGTRSTVWSRTNRTGCRPTRERWS